MKKIKENNKLLASLAVFRELYNAEKDVFGIIAAFLNDLIKSNSLYSFSLSDITSKFNTTFEFEIPSAVVKTSLGRLDFIEKNRGTYIVKDISKIKSGDVDEKQKSIISNNDLIINNLFNFVEKKKKTTLNQVEKEKISYSFCCFLLDESNGDEYIEFITAFILENESNLNFKNQLNLIREGVILYSGIKYSHNLNDLGTWRSELTIYLDTEIIFHIAGFNGDLYRTLALDFFVFVNEINQKAQKKLIRLKYFKEVKNEIEDFFTKARYLIERSERPNPSGTAMVFIMNGCSKPSDILEKRTDFYSLLKSYNIDEDNYNDYYNINNRKYNVVSPDILDKVNKELCIDAEINLRFLNYISILRADADANNFDNIRFILLSGTSATLKLAWHDLIKEGHIPLATHLNFLTSKFWFKLNKGFGKNTLPKSFDIITKAQISLSNILNNTVGEKYTELQKEYKEGRLTEEQAKARIIDLRNQVRKPEEIKNDIVKDVLSAITEDSLEKFIEEQSHFKTKSEQHQIENKILQEELDRKRNIEEKYIQTKEELLSEKMKFKETLEIQKSPLDIMAGKKYRNLKIIIGSIILGYYVLLVILIFRFTWNIMEQYTYILSAIPFVISFLYLLFFEHTINPLTMLKKLQQKCLLKTYKYFAFDIEKLDETNEAVKKIKDEIAELRKAEEKGTEGRC